jgi:hypothetical protein
MLLVRFDASFSPRYGTTQPVLGWTCKHHRELGGSGESRGCLSRLPRGRSPRRRRHHGCRTTRRSPLAGSLGRARSAAMGGGHRTLEVVAARHFTATNQESLVADLRSILSPQCVTRARDVAAAMAKSAEVLPAQPICWKTLPGRRHYPPSSPEIPRSMLVWVVAGNTIRPSSSLRARS